MIEINLLPDELKAKSEASDFKFNYLVYFMPLIVGVLIVIHFSIGAVQVLKIAQQNSLNGKLKSLESEKIRIEKQKQIEADPARRLITEMALKSVVWSKKLNKLSFYLPEGVWFNEISVSKKEMIIRGSVYSAEKKEMDLINRFMSGLRNDQDFIKNFTNLELGLMQTKTFGSYDVIDFSIILSLNAS